ncbi:hypothetical protein [Nocardia tengchongensis]|uniref:hypothetical protein n=1 Tax=Nocardia tengchongensis TaxID=2055889 RepID=UPI0036B95995
MTVDPALEALLVDHVRQIAAQVHDAATGTLGWRYRSHYDLLLEHGRLFAPAPLSAALRQLPETHCYTNALATIANHTGSLGYAEGIAYCTVGNSVLPVAHGWCYLPDGTVQDPTWADGIGRAYLGVAIADPAHMPRDGRGIFADFQRLQPMLKDVVPEPIFPTPGRTLPAGPQRRDQPAPTTRRPPDPITTAPGLGISARRPRKL